MMCVLAALGGGGIYGQSSAQSQSSSNAAKPRAKQAIRPKGGESEIDPGSVANGLYRNKTLALTYKIPAGWVLRTDEMNAREDEDGTGNQGSPASPSQESRSGCPHECSRVLLAAFSRPPDARGEDINASILIAAESVAAYPGLTDAAQYFGPLTEVAKAQGFTMDEEPYEIALGTKTLMRGDFQKDVGTRVMRQSTLALLSHGYAVSITVIGGTEDEVEELIDGVSFEKK